VEIAFGFSVVLLVALVTLFLTLREIRQMGRNPKEEVPAATKQAKWLSKLTHYNIPAPDLPKGTAESYISRPSFQEAAKSYEEEYVKLMEEKNAR